MSFAEAIQLYLPLAGLLSVVFWLGVLSQRVKTLEKDGGGSIAVAMARLDERMGRVESGLVDLANNIALAPPPGYSPRPRKATP